jgi:guanosine-3',5'-bis(diphosphate) 3'-pyrophosphohydrolase
MDALAFSQFLDALQFAAQQHRNQRRKGPDHQPYINHLIDVVDLLWRVGGVRDPVTLVAGLLHDAIEDTGTTAEEIERRFGPQVLAVVLEVTDDKSLPKAERKRLQVEHAPHKSQRAKQVKLADKISNVRDVLANPPADWPPERCHEYLEWAGQVVAGLRGACPALEIEFDSLFNHGATENTENI